MKLDTDIGRLDRRITIQKQSVGFDSIGNQKTVLTDFHNCWAAVSGVSGREYWEAREQHEENTLSFKIRYCRKLADIDKINYFIRYNGKVYDITDINNLNAADSLLIIKAVERT